MVEATKDQLGQVPAEHILRDRRVEDFFSQRLMLHDHVIGFGTDGHWRQAAGENTGVDCAFYFVI